MIQYHVYALMCYYNLKVWDYVKEAKERVHLVSKGQATMDVTHKQYIDKEVKLIDRRLAKTEPVVILDAAASKKLVQKRIDLAMGRFSRLDIDCVGRMLTHLK